MNQELQLRQEHTVELTNLKPSYVADSRLKDASAFVITGVEIEINNPGNIILQIIRHNQDGTTTTSQLEMGRYRFVLTANKYQFRPRAMKEFYVDTSNKALKEIKAFTHRFTVFKLKLNLDVIPSS